MKEDITYKGTSYMNSDGTTTTETKFIQYQHTDDLILHNIIISYLEWLHEIMDNWGFTLILDVYLSYLKKVEITAKSFGHEVEL